MSIKDQIISVMDEVVNFEYTLKEREQKQQAQKFCEAALKAIQKDLEFLCNQILPKYESEKYIEFLKEDGYRFSVLEAPSYKVENQDMYLLQIKSVILEDDLIELYNELNKVMYMNEELTDFARKNDLYNIEIVKIGDTYYWNIFAEIDKEKYEEYRKFLSEHKA